MRFFQNTSALFLGACLVASTPMGAQVLPIETATGTSFFTVTPCRIFDTRTSNTPLLSGTTRVFAVAVERCGIPPTALAVAVNLTIVAPTGAGHVRAFPGDGSIPVTSTINFSPGQTRANNAILRLAENGEGSIALIAFVQGPGQVHAILDVNGYFEVEDLEIRSLSPSSAPQGGPELSLAVIGTGFQDDAVVRFDGHDLGTTAAGPGRLIAVVPASRLETAGTFPVQVVNPDGTASGAALFTVDAPLSLSALVPAGVATGSPNFSLTLSGAGFKPEAVAHFGDTTLTTTFIGSGMLTTTVPATLVAQPGEVTVTVENPGGPTSSPLSFKMKSLSFTGITPSSGPVGTAVTVTGNGLDLLPAVLFAKQGGGTLQAVLLSNAATSLQVSVPTGTTTGPVRLVSGGLTLTGPVFTVTPSRTFDLAGGPASGVLFPGSSVNYGITATSPNGFAGLVSLQVNGLPSGVSFKLDPPQLSAGQTANLTVSAPAGQPVGLTPFTVTGTGSIEGQTLNRTLNLSLDIRPVSTSFIGRVAAAEAFEYPLVGVTVKFLGESLEGVPNDCSIPMTRTDAGGNFSFIDLPEACTGPQLVAFGGVTDSGQLYTPVNLRFAIQSGVINHTPGLIHLTPIYDAETILVRQNWSSDQIFMFQTIPGIKLQVYAGTIFTNPDGSAPDPFPLTGLRIPIDRPPGDKTFPIGQIMPFLLSLQPEGARASQAVAVDYPNTVSGQPGSVVTLLTLDPRVGMMVSYGTGTISADGLSIVADPNPATPGKRFGLTHFDWHGPITPNVPAAGRATTGAERCGDAVLGGTCAASWSCTSPVTGVHSVEYATGAEAMEVVDATITGIPLPVGFVRLYRSDLAGFTGPLGFGTSHSLNYVLLTGRDSNQPLINLALPNSRQATFVRRPDGIYGPAASAFTRGSSLRWVAAQGRYRLDTIDGSALFFTPSLNAVRSSLSAITDRHGNQIQLVHGVGPGNVETLERIIAANGEKIELQNDAQNRIHSVTDAAGRVTLYDYDAIGRLETVTDPAGGVTRYGYDDQNHLTTITDARGIVVVTKEYDDAGRVIREIFPDTGELHYSYMTANPADPATPVLQTQVTDPLGRTTTYRFTVTGELTDVTDALGQMVSFEIDPISGRYHEREGTAECPVCGSASGDQSYEYDDQGRITKVTDALGSSTSFTYPEIGQVPERVTDALSRTTTFTQNAMGDVTEVTDPSGKVWRLTYDTAGRLLTLTDPNQHTTTLSHGSEGRPDSVTDALGRTTQFSYDVAGRLSSISAPDGTTEYLAHDALDRITSIENAFGHLARFTYDAVGNLISLTDPKGNATTFEYDDLSRPIREIAPDGSARVFEHDLKGNLNSVTDRNGHTATFTYDALDRPRDALYDDGTVLRFEWDPTGRLLAADDFVGGRVERAYDTLGRLISEISPTGALNYEYDALSRRTLRTGPDGETVYTYTQQGQVESITNGAMSVHLTYDDAGQLTTAFPPNGVTVNYTYDAAHQLNRIDYAGPGGFSDFRVYTYDLNGQVTSVSGNSLTPPLPSPQAANFDGRNRIITMNGKLFQHDAEGRLVADGLRTYHWDDRGRLLEAVAAGGRSTYRYDALGRRIARTTHGRALSYLFDGQDVLRIVVDSSGFDFLRGLALDETWAERTDGYTKVFIRDHLGTTIATINSTGLDGRVVYEEYGVAHVVAGSSPRFQYTGREQDDNQLLFLRARYYEPTIGRFISPDPLGGAETNRYSYANNSPPNFIDLLGLQALPPWWPLLEPHLHIDEHHSAQERRKEWASRNAHALRWREQVLERLTRAKQQIYDARSERNEAQGAIAYYENEARAGCLTSAGRQAFIDLLNASIVRFNQMQSTLVELRAWESRLEKELNDIEIEPPPLTYGVDFL